MLRLRSQYRSFEPDSVKPRPRARQFNVEYNVRSSLNRFANEKASAARRDIQQLSFDLWHVRIKVLGLDNHRALNSEPLASTPIFRHEFAYRNRFTRADIIFAVLTRRHNPTNGGVCRL